MTPASDSTSTSNRFLTFKCLRCNNIWADKNTTLEPEEIHCPRCHTTYPLPTIVTPK